MPRVLDPIQLVMIALAGRMNQRQLQTIEYLREENRFCASNSETDECDSTTTSDVDWQPRRKAWAGDVWRKSSRLLHRRPCWRGIESLSLRSMMAASDADPGDLARVQSWELGGSHGGRESEFGVSADSGCLIQSEAHTGAKHHCGHSGTARDRAGARAEPHATPETSANLPIRSSVMFPPVDG